MKIYEATTPTFSLTNDDVDFTTLGTCRVDMVQGDTELHITSPTVAAHSISFTLTQAQTLGFEPNYPVEVQANFYQNDSRCCTVPIAFNIAANLYDEVMQ